MRLCKELGLQLMFTRPIVIQKRNAHDYLADFDSEDDLYKRSGTLLKQLMKWQPTSTSLPSMMEELWIYMFERDYIEIGDVFMLQRWIEALAAVGYEFPTVTQESIDRAKEYSRRGTR